MLVWISICVLITLAALGVTQVEWSNVSFRIANWVRSRSLQISAKRRIRRNPRDAQAFCELAIAYQCLGYHEDALKNAQRATELKPKEFDPWMCYGICALALANETEYPLRKEEALWHVEKAGERLLTLCEGAQGDTLWDPWYMHACTSSVKFLQATKSSAKAKRAFKLAVETARKWADDKDSKMRYHGEGYLEWLLERDVYGLADTIERDQ